MIYTIKRKNVTQEINSKDEFIHLIETEVRDQAEMLDNKALSELFIQSIATLISHNTLVIGDTEFYIDYSL